MVTDRKVVTSLILKGFSVRLSAVTGCVTGFLSMFTAGYLISVTTYYILLFTVGNRRYIHGIYGRYILRAELKTSVRLES